MTLLSLIGAGWANFADTVRGQATSADGPPLGAVSSKLLRFSQRLVERHDRNRDGLLDATEWSAMQGQPAQADLNRDGQLTADELARYAAGYGVGRRIRLSTRGNAGPADPTIAADGTTTVGTPASAADPLAADPRRALQFFAPLPGGTPSWFAERDSDGDAQLTLSEFSPRLRTAEVTEFKRYDLNGDGLLTINELTKAGSKPAGTASGAADAPGSVAPAGSAPAKP
jgi:hypothetical protein